MGGALWVGGCGAGSPGSARSPADPVVARVNGRPVHESRVAAVIAEARLVNQTITEAQALDGVIDEELLRQEAERLGVAPPAALVEARVRALERRVGGAAALDEALKSVRLTRAQLRERLAVVVLGERVAAAKFPQLRVTRRAAQAYYRRHLFVFTAPAAVKLGDIVVRTKRMARGRHRAYPRRPELLRDGEDVHHATPSRSGSAGSLAGCAPTRCRRRSPGLWRSCSPGQISEPVQSLGGFNVIKLYAQAGGADHPLRPGRSEGPRRRTEPAPRTQP